MPEDTVEVPMPGPITPVEEVECDSMSIKELLLYKMDRTLAVIGLIAIGVWALETKTISSSAAQITGIVVGGLVTYIGGRTK